MLSFRRYIVSAVLTLVTLSSAALAHVPEDVAKLHQNYEHMVRVLKAYAEDVSGSEPSDIGRIQVGDESIPVNISAMNQIITLASIARHLDDPATFDESKKHRLSQTIKKILFSIPKRIFTVARAPVTSAIDFWQGLQDLYFENEIFAMRTIYGFDPAVAAYIIVSQLGFEGTESIVMPAGIHLFCGFGNAVILLTAIPMERAWKLSQNNLPYLSLSGRMEVVLAALLRSAKGSFGWFKDIRMKHGVAELSLDKSTFRNMTLNELDKVLLASKDFAPLFAALGRGTNTQDFVISRNVLSDIDLVFDQKQTTAVRFYAALAHTRGFAIPLTFLEKMADNIYDAKTFQNRETNLAFARLVGRVRTIITTYTASMIFLSALDTDIIKSDTNAQYKAFILDLLGLYDEIGKFTATKAPGKDSPETLTPEAQAISDTAGLNRLNQLASTLMEKTQRMIRGKPEPESDAHEAVTVTCDNSFNQ